ncbi:MAG: hypothetical protein ACYC2H_07240 [Thermoplasmatota archaeon]
MAIEIDLEWLEDVLASAIEGKTWCYFPSGKPRRISPRESRRIAHTLLASGGLIERPTRPRPADDALPDDDATGSEEEIEGGSFRPPRPYPRYNPPPFGFPPWEGKDFWEMVRKLRADGPNLPKRSGLVRAAKRQWYAEPKALFTYAKGDATWEGIDTDKRERRDRALEQLEQICRVLDIVVPGDHAMRGAWLEAKRFFEEGPPLEDQRWSWKGSKWRPRPGETRAGNKVSQVAIVAAAALRTPLCRRRWGLDEAIALLYDDLGLPPPEIEVALQALETFAQRGEGGSA